MNRDTMGQSLTLTLFGESHGPAVGCVVQGLAPGLEIDLDFMARQLQRRKGAAPLSTGRREADLPQILSGAYQGRTTGTALCLLIPNQDTHSKDYGSLWDTPRPGHGDYTGRVKYQSYNDPRGGGHFSGRLTAPLVFAGSVCRQILRRRGIAVGSHILNIAGVEDDRLDARNVDAQQLEDLARSRFPLLRPEREGPMRDAVEAARLEADSVGGVIEAAATGLPAGVGSPMFEGIENRLAPLLFGIPAVKGLEFGEGFSFASLRGSQANDPYTIEESGRIVTTTNHNGGVLGGITNGMPLVLRLVIKPTSSIGKEQQTVDLISGKPASLVVKGRHDPCIVPRAVPVVEAVLALGLLDILESENAPR